MAKAIFYICAIALVVYTWGYLKAPLYYAFSPIMDAANYLMEALGGKL